MDISSLIRQLGLAARGGAEGAAALPSMLWNGPADTINWATGTRIPRADIGPALDALGLPRPENSTERVAQDVVGALGAGGGALSLARRGAEFAADPAARAMAALFAQAPLAQLGSAGISAGAAGTARENGANQSEQALIGILAGLAPVAPAAAGARGAFSSKLEPTGAGEFGPVYGRLAGDTDNAVAHLLHTEKGEVPGALSHAQVDHPIDLVYGVPGTGASDGYGVSKMARFHPESLHDLQGFVGDLPLIPEKSGPNRMVLESPESRAVVSRNWKGEPKTWLLSAYEKDKGPANGALTGAGKTIDTSNITGAGNHLPTSAASIGDLRDPRQYVGLLSTDEAAARRAALAKRLRDALFGGALGTGMATD